MTKIIYISFAVIALLMLTALHAYAQTPPPAAVPLDGFTGLLIAAGVGVGYRALNRGSEK